MGTAVAEAFLSAFFTGDWDAAAGAVDSASLKVFANSGAVTALYHRLRGDDEVGDLLNDAERLALVSDNDFRRLPPARLLVLFLKLAHSRDAKASHTAELVGTVVENSDLEHVVYRVRPADPTRAVDRMFVLSVRREGGVWRVHLGQDFIGGGNTVIMLEP